MKINMNLKFEEHLMYASVTAKGLFQHKSKVQIFAWPYLALVPFELAPFFFSFSFPASYKNQHAACRMIR